MRESLDFMSLTRLCACPVIHLTHLGVWLVLHVHVRLLCLVSAIASSFASAPASLAVVAHARSTPMHDAHNSCSDTVGFRVSRAQRGSKVGFLVRPKICVLSQWWRQG